MAQEVAAERGKKEADVGAAQAEEKEGAIVWVVAPKEALMAR